MGNQASVDESYYTTGAEGLEHLVTLSQQQLASLVRAGLDLDMVLNPYQMERLNEDDDTKQGPEVADAIHVNNSAHINPKSIVFAAGTVEEALNGISFKLRFRYSATVPFRLSVHFFVEETTGDDGCPHFNSLSSSASLSSPIRLQLSPSLDSPVEINIPTAYIDRLILIGPNASTSNLIEPSLAGDLRVLQTMVSKPTFHHLIIQTEVAVPVTNPDISAKTTSTPLSDTYGATSETNSSLNSPTATGGAKGFSSAEWNFIKLKYTKVRTGASAEVSFLSVDTIKRAFAAGRGLFEALEMYGWDDVPEADQSNSNSSNPNEFNIDLQNSSINGSPDCVVCMSIPSELAILPCRHLCLCIECAKTIATRAENAQQIKCPMCREKISAYVDVRF